MPEVELLAIGEGDYRHHDPDVRRAWMRARTRRGLVDETGSVADAASRLVASGDHRSCDVPSHGRGPRLLIRGVIRPVRRARWSGACPR